MYIPTYKIKNMYLVGGPEKPVKSALFEPKPSLKIGTANAIYWNSLGLFRDYGLNYIFFRNKTFLFFKLFEKEFRVTSQNSKSIRQWIQNMKIKIV